MSNDIGDDFLRMEATTDSNDSGGNRTAAHRQLLDNFHR